MPVKVESTHIILPRELILYLRSDSDVWQCRLKVDGKWMARTTKERDVNKAVERAKRLLFEAQLRKEANIWPAQHLDRFHYGFCYLKSVHRSSVLQRFTRLWL